MTRAFSVDGQSAETPETRFDNEGNRRIQITESLRICIVCHEYPPAVCGGIGTYTRKMGQALVEAGHEVRTIGVYASGCEKVTCEDDHGVSVWRLPSKRGRLGSIVNRYRLYRMLANWCRRGEIDLIELPDWRGWAAGWLPLFVPVVVRLHGSGTYFAIEAGRRPSWLVRKVERASLLRADYWCSVSRYTADRTRDVFALQSRSRAIIYNSVELKPRRSIDERSKTDVVYTGTLTLKKGVVSLIRAWPAVLRANPDARLDLYGRDGRSNEGGSMLEYLLSLLDEDVRQTVTFHGHQPRERILELLERARVAVFPSHAEAFALAPLESMACGCPTIYSQRGSGSELIEHGRDGLLIDPDKPDQISEAIVSVLQNDELAARLGKQGWERVRDRFTLKQIVSENEQFYRQCIDEYRLSDERSIKANQQILVRDPPETSMANPVTSERES